MTNIPEVKLGIIAVSRDCFPIALSTERRNRIAEVYGEGRTRHEEGEGLPLSEGSTGGNLFHDAPLRSLFDCFRKGLQSMCGATEGNESREA